jgi:hypothetical protein
LVVNNRSSLTIVKSFKVAELWRAWVCGRSLAGILGSNPAGDMAAYLLSVLSVVG